MQRLFVQEKNICFLMKYLFSRIVSMAFSISTSSSKLFVCAASLKCIVQKGGLFGLSPKYWGPLECHFCSQSMMGQFECLYLMQRFHRVYNKCYNVFRHKMQSFSKSVFFNILTNQFFFNFYKLRLILWSCALLFCVISFWKVDFGEVMPTYNMFITEREKKNTQIFSI